MQVNHVESNWHTTLYILILIFIAFSLISIAGTHITLGLIALVWLAQMILSRQMTIEKTSLEIAFGIFVLALLVASAFSAQPRESFINLKNVLLISVVYIVSSNLLRQREIITAIDVFVGVATVMAAIGLLSTDILGGKRVMGFKSTTMTWGAMSAIFTSITGSLFLFVKNSKKRWLYLGAFVIQFVSMLFSYVRGSWLGFLASVLILILVKNKKLLLFFIVLMVIVFIAAPDSIQNRVLSITDMNVGSTKVRFTQWGNAVKILKDHPIVGVGWIDLGEIHRAYAPEGADLNYQAYRIGHFHNNFVMIAVCFGLVGLAAVLFMVFKIFQIELKIHRALHEKNSVLSGWVIGSVAAYAGFWVNGLFDWTFGDAEPATLIWLTIGLSIAIGKRIAKPSNGN
ncbi:MAG: O-antigen ligase family protein [Candidatus Zhuqueibacterota bacterium]